MKNVVFRFHGGVAGISAVHRAAGVGREFVCRGVVVEDRVAPAARFRESLAVFFHDEIGWAPPADGCQSDK